MSAPMETARRVADAVLYEGYLLYPYRASAAKNRMRWQFGVLVPRGFSSTGEPSSSVTECLLEPAEDALLDVRLRFLHVKARTVEQAEGEGHRPVPELAAGERIYITFDEATEREAGAVLPVADLIGAERMIEVRVPGDQSVEPIIGPAGERLGRVVAEHRPVRASLLARAERLAGPYGLVKLRVGVENTTAWEGDDASRAEALRGSLIAAHLLIGVSGGTFVSLLDPPEWAREAAEACHNEHTWPVLVGDPGHREVVLSSPIILYDYPAIAPESPGDLFDSTEIDELLSLRTMTLTDEEKREAAATDPRVAEILERTGDLPPELLERLHGAIRYVGAPVDEGPVENGQLEGVPPQDGPAQDDPAQDGAPTPWWNPGADTGVSPETDSVIVAGTVIARGSRVRLNPGRRRADAHDMFLAGRTARVEAVLLDVDGVRHLAVTLEDDPAADLHRAHGRFLYFAPDEVEPIGDGDGEETA
ncbi:hypothetical protein [Planotetraspora sp. GP83]|uniref:hypothetical protein n=1 Tax=Planotetraspora sp. GP83 TaxID=3156264 RepID=UPI0035126283